VPEAHAPTTIVSYVLPFALRKGSVFVPLYIPFQIMFHYIVLHIFMHLLSLSFIFIPNTYKQTMSSPGWKSVMDEEMSALHQNQNLEL